MSRLAPVDGIPEPESFNGPDDQPMPSVQTRDEEYRKERDWYDLEVTARDFKDRYGAAAMLRCVSRALDRQLELIEK